MSLAIDINKVSAVLLSDGWHHIYDRSFYIDSYEYLDREASDSSPGYIVHGGGDSGIVSVGFGFLEDLDGNAGVAYQGDVVQVSGPLTAILAVQERR